MSKQRKWIKVTFRDNEAEDKLHNDIIAESKIQLMSVSVWMKQASKEKLERDRGKGQMSNSPMDNSYMNDNRTYNKQPSNQPIIDDIDDLYMND